MNEGRGMRRKSTLSELEERAASLVVDSALAVHRTLGPGLLERVYEACLCHELAKRGAFVERQVVVPIVYEGLTFDEGFRIDVLVDGIVLCELKAVDDMNPVYTAQLLSYMKMSGKRIGFLINFNVTLIKNGIRRYVL
jgi:GxxExxY protein